MNWRYINIFSLCWQSINHCFFFSLNEIQPNVFQSQKIAFFERWTVSITINIVTTINFYALFVHVLLQPSPNDDVSIAVPPNFTSQTMDIVETFTHTTKERNNFEKTIHFLAIHICSIAIIRICWQVINSEMKTDTFCTTNQWTKRMANGKLNTLLMKKWK